MPAPAKKKKPLRKPVRRTPAWLGPVASMGGLALLVVAFLAYRYMTTPPDLPPPSAETTDAVLHTINTLPASEFDQVGLGSATQVLQKTTDSLLTGGSGKPLIFYFGGEYCPYCAAERWALIIALSRFGTFAGLSTTTSSSTDVFPNTPTFTFHGATYTSGYIEFQSVEGSDRQQNPLENPSGAQQALITKYDTHDTIPVVDLGNRFILLQPSYTPDVLAGKNWTQVANALTNPDSAEAQAIVGSANLLTAAICKVTANQPAEVCTPAIESIEAKL